MEGTMKQIRRVCAHLAGSFLLVTLCYGSTEKYWLAADAAMSQGLPRTAINNLDTILTITQKEKKYEEWLRALTQKVVIEAVIQGNKPEEKVRRLKAEFDKADTYTRPLLQATLAQWYWHYYDRNRWRFMNRTATEKLSEEDFTTWDLPKLFGQIDSLYQDVLKQKQVLVKIQARQFLGFLEAGLMPVELRPTLYDFIAHEALDFYTNAEQAAAKPEDAFEIDAGSDAFAPAEQFLQYKPLITDTTAPKYKALILYQSLMAFHLERKDTESFADIDIERLNYVKNASFGEERNKIFIRRMTDVIEKYEALPISSLAAYYLAKAWAEEDNLVKAYNLAQDGYERYPKSIGGKCCMGYTIELMRKAITLTCENSVPPERSQIQISYKNFTKVYFRIYNEDWNDVMTKDYYDGWRNRDSIINVFLSKEPFAEWSTDLPPTVDLKEKKMMLDVPKLKPGYYRIFASWQPDFRNSTMVQFTSFWVCSFTLISRSGGFVDGLVLDAVSGDPIAGAIVTKIPRQDYYRRILGDKTATDANGYFRFDYKNNEQYLLYVKKGDEELLTSNDIYAWRQYQEEPDQRIVFFTDRSLYRPGQTIYFKGICVYVDKGRSKYEVLPSRDITVYFRDVNGKRIESETFTTNDFGSISGQFIAPTDRLTGSMSLQAAGYRGMASLRVEEYKRPKFSVELETPRQAVKLYREIEITGKALAYTGAPVDNASVQFSVRREASYPYWWYWFHFNSERQSENQQIAHGKIKTDGDGNFKITFFSKPDPKISTDDNPTFTYRIHADVVSPDGETRSADTYVRIGYSALALNIESGEYVENNVRFPLIVGAQTLDGNALTAKAEIRIYRLKQPAQPIRARLSAQWRNDAFEDAYGGFGDNWMVWPNDDVVYETSISTERSNPDTIFSELPAGLYKVEAIAKDKYGKEVKAFLPLMVLPDGRSKKFNIKLPSVAKAKNAAVQVGKDLQVFWGTGYESGRCFIEIERDNTVLREFWTENDHTQHSFVFPVTADLRGGFLVRVTQVRENRAYFHTIPIEVPWDNKNLDVTIETFRDRMTPGEQETMTLKVKGKKNPIEAAEMVATLYDCSLDQFYPHQWQGFDFFKRGYSNRNVVFINAAQVFQSWHNHWNAGAWIPTVSYIHFPIYIIENLFYYRFPTFTTYNKLEGRCEIIYGKEIELKANLGKFEGRVVDALTSESLPGASIALIGTTLGATTDANGFFSIREVPIGEYRAIASYIGYSSMKSPKVNSLKGKTTTINFKLMQATIAGEEVVVTAQAKGQMAVMSQQVMVNGLAAAGDRIRELPDMNAAAALARLPGVSVKTIDLNEIVIRKNLNETAFFYPHLLMDNDGVVKLEFSMPEALTKWKFMGFSHGKECENGFVTAYTVTRKDLMVQPNAPRFLREGDTIYFTAKVVNASEQPQQGRVQLSFKDLITEQPMDSALHLTENVQPFEVKPHSSETYSWRIVVPKGANPLTYTVAAKTNTVSDGETGALPVLSSRIFLTESVPLHIRGPKTRNFAFERLKNIGKSQTFEPYRFTVQMASNPTWYVIQALPYLIEYPFECSEQVFNRFYANSLAAYIANSNPRIQKVFDEWRRTGALKSNLEKNQELKSVLLMETPWVRAGENESQAKKNIAFLFEKNTLQSNLNSAFAKLQNYQFSDGSWPWFPGGRPSEYITLYITTGFGRLKHLGVKVDNSMALKALDFLDRWIVRTHDDIRDAKLDNLSSTIALYLYCRSFYLEERPIPDYARKAFDYYARQAEEHWLTLNSRLSQGYVALALHRLGRTETPKRIVASIKERSVENEEMGMFWREDELSWWWYRAPIETQALMIEAFSEITKDTAAVEDCKVWLLKQKQTQNWKTTKATADAVYALVLRGTDYLSQTRPVAVKVGNVTIQPEKIEAGTGYYDKIFYRNEIKPQFSTIAVTKEDKGIAWGGVYLQYFEEMSNVTPHSTNLHLEKKLFIKRDTKKGKTIEPIAGPLSVGDLITVRIILKVDRDMEYVHLKDMRGSGLEPVSVLSGYRYQDGLRYYQSTKDAATHFFIDYLSKGTYVFEYDLRVQLKGQYQSGIAEIQCMYAPEFNSHSASQRLEVQ